MDLKEEAKSLGKGILYICVVLLTISLFSTNLFTSWLILMGFNIIYLKYIGKFTWFTLFKNGLLLGGILFMFKLLSGFGIFGYIMGTLAICLLILYQRKEKYMEIKHHGETMIWGKPLKEFIKEGKKPPKIKITR